MGLIITLVPGIVVGWLFSVIVKNRGFGLFGSMALGVIGSFVAVFLSQSLGFSSRLPIRFLIPQIVGAVIPLFLASLFRKRLAKPGRGKPPPPPADPPPKQPSRHSPSNIFISYRRQDNPDVTGRIYDRLIDHFGQERVFLDVDAVPLGVDFRTYLDEKVGKCHVLIAVIGNQWLDTKDAEGNRRIHNQDDFVRIEIESALKRGIPVIPILVTGATMPREVDLPSTLRKLAYRHGLSIRTDPDFHKDVNRLIAGLEVHLWV